MRTSRFDILQVIVWLGLILLFGVISINGCEVDDNTARKTVEAQGFKDVKLGGTSTFSCSEDERSRRFTAVNSRGDSIEGVVCCGFSGCGKACTLRW